MKKILSFFVAALFGVSTFAATKTTVYYTAPESVIGSYTVKLNTNQQTNPDKWETYVMTKTELKHGEDPIYSASFTDLWDGVEKMQFQLYDGDTWKSQDEPIKSWAGAATYNGKMYAHTEGKWMNVDGSDIEPAKGFFVTGDSAFVKDAADLDKSKAWNTDAIKSEKDTLELNLKAAVEYNLKVVTVNGEWKGYSDLSEVAKGVNDNKGNISFKLKEDGKVQIIYFIAEDKLTFKLVGEFEAVEIEDGYYLNGSHVDWNIAKLTDYKFAKNEDNKEVEEYTLKITLTKGQKIKPCKIEGSKATAWYPEVDGDFEVTDEAAGKKIVYFRPTKNDEWNICGGHIYIAADEEGGGDTPTPDPEFDGKFYITGNEALVVAAGLDKAKAWDPAAIACENSEYTFTALAVGDYVMKITVDGKWETAKGFSDLAERPKGVTADKDGNINFSIAEAGDVKIKFNGAKITLEGKFDESKEITLTDGYYLISDPWTLESIKAANKFEANEGTEGEFKLSATLTEGMGFKVVEVKDNAIVKWFPEGEGNEYKVDAAHAGARTIYFRPAGNDEWKGFIYVDEGAAPDPGDQAIDNTAVEMKTVKTFENGQLIIIKNGVKYNANGTILK